jgi:hypothetical protein
MPAKKSPAKSPTPVLATRHKDILEVLEGKSPLKVSLQSPLEEHEAAPLDGQPEGP